MNILHVGSCEIVEIRDSADELGFPCPRTASKECSDCGSSLCESHTETCGICKRHILPALLDVPFSAALQICLSRPQTSSGAKKSLEFQRSVRRVGLCRNSLVVRLPR